MLGTGVAQLLPLLMMPILTRLYSEEEFGVYSTFLAYSAVLIVAVSARYQVAILLPKQDEDALKVFKLSNIITSVTSLFLLLISLVIYLGFKNPLNQNGLIFLIPIYVFFFGLWQSYFNLSIRFKKFKVTAIPKIVQSIGYIGISCIIGLIFTPLGLVLGKAAGVLSSLMFIIFKLKPKKHSFSGTQLKEAALKYIDYPKFNLIPALLDTLSLQALIILIGYYYTDLELGYFGLANICISAPLALIGVAYRDVFYQRITSLINDNQIRHAKSFFLKSSAILGLLGVSIFFILFFYGADLFSFVFGLKWSTSGKFASILAFSLVFRLVVSPLSSILYATGKVKIVSLWQSIYFVTTFSTLFIAILIYKSDIYALLKVYVLHEVVLYMLYYYLQYNSINKLIK